MNIAIRYFTKSGNTEKLANAISEQINIQAYSISHPLEQQVDLLFLGCSYYAFDMDAEVKKFLKENHDKISQMVLFGSSAMMKSMKKPMAKVIHDLNISLLDEEFHCHGSFGPMHKGKPDENDIIRIKEFAKNMISK